MNTAIIIPTLDPDSDMIRACLEALGDQEVVVQHDEYREGFAVTCNKAAKETDAETLVFLNDDTIPTKGWLSELRQHTVHSVTGGHLFYPDGRTQHSGIFLRRRGTILEAYNRKRPAQSGDVPAVTGACLGIRADWFNELGGFDESFVNGYEDVDLCLRARRDLDAGVWFAAHSQVIHLESQSDPELRFGHAQENIALLQERWGSLPV